MIALTSTRGLKRNLRLALTTLCFLVGLARAAQDGIAGAFANASAQIEANTVRSELIKKLKLTPYFVSNRNDEAIQTFVQKLDDDQVRTINSIPADCSPGWWPVTSIKSLERLLAYAVEKNSGNTKFRPIPRVEGEANGISCKVEGWGCEKYPMTSLSFRVKNGTVLCSAAGYYKLGHNRAEDIRMTDVRVLEVKHVEDTGEGTLKAPFCAHYQIIPDTFFGSTLNITIQDVNPVHNETQWEKILNFIRNVDTTIVKCRPQTRPDARKDLPRRRLTNRPKSHIGVLEALLKEINRLN